MALLSVLLSLFVFVEVEELRLAKNAFYFYSVTAYNKFYCCVKPYYKSEGLRLVTSIVLD